MLYYKIEAIVDNVPKNMKNKKNSRNSMNISTCFTQRFESFAQKAQNEFYLFFCMRDVYIKNKVVVGCLSKSTPFSHIKQQLPSFFLQFEMIPQVIEAEEVTLIDFDNMFDDAERNYYLQNRLSVIRQMGIDRDFYRYGIRLFRYHDWVCRGEPCEEELLHGAKELLCNSTLLPEIHRIYTPPTRKKVFGHPVHYIISCDEIDKTKKIIELLVAALYKNGRLQSKRYCFVPAKDCDDEFSNEKDTYYSWCEGGTIAVELKIGQEEERPFSRRGDDFLELFCASVKKIRIKR